MSVKKRKWKTASGATREAYWVRWQDENGVYRSQTLSDTSRAGKDRAEALDKEMRDRVRAAKLGVVVADPDAGAITLHEFTSTVFRDTVYSGWSATTRKTEDSRYAKHVEPTFGDKALRAITRESVKVWYAKLHAEAPATADKSLKLLAAILREAVESERIAANPALIKRRTRATDEVRVFSVAEVESIRTAFGEDHRSAMLTALCAYAGVRPGEEVMALTWSDVLWDADLLKVERLKTGRGKGRRRTTVDLLPWLKADLRAYYLRCGRPVATTPILDGLDYANFTGKGRPWDRALEVAGIDYAAPYSLRHSFASMLLASGQQVFYVADQMGHTTPALVISTYGHLIAEYKGRTIDAAEEVRLTRAA